MTFNADEGADLAQTHQADEKERLAQSYYQTAEMLLSSRHQGDATRQAAQRWGREQLRLLRQSELHLARHRGLQAPGENADLHPHGWMLDVICDLGTYAEEHG